MEILELLKEPLSLPALLVAAGFVLKQLLPITSRRSNKLAARLVRAKAKQTR